MQQGVVEWSKKSIVLENGSKALCAATSSSAIRGRTMNCVTGETLVTICDDYGNIFNIAIEEANSSKYIMNTNLNLWENKFMYYTVYKITNLLNKKEYIGYHQTNNLNDGYMGSGKLIKKAIVKYGIENFQKEYIEIFGNREDAESLEAFLVCEKYTLRSDTYNIALGGNVRTMVGKNNPWYNMKHTEETLDILREKNIGKNKKIDDDIIIDSIRYNSFYHMAKSLNFTIGQLKEKMTEDKNGYVDKEKQSNFLDVMEKIKTRKLKNNISQSILMKEKMSIIVRTDEWKLNISKSLTGKKKTKEHSDKINKNPEKIKKTAEKNLGSSRTDETKKKMSDLKVGKEPKNKGKICIYNLTTFEVKTVSPQPIPIGWTRGTGPRNKKCQKS
jgi:hypothetical protein